MTDAQEVSNTSIDPLLLSSSHILKLTDIHPSINLEELLSKCQRFGEVKFQWADDDKSSLLVYNFRDFDTATEAEAFLKNYELICDWYFIKPPPTVESQIINFHCCVIPNISNVQLIAAVEQSYSVEFGIIRQGEDVIKLTEFGDFISPIKSFQAAPHKCSDFSSFLFASNSSATCNSYNVPLNTDNQSIVQCIKIVCTGEPSNIELAMNILNGKFNEETTTLKLAVHRWVHTEDLVRFAQNYLVEVQVTEEGDSTVISVTGWCGYVQRVWLLLKEKSLEFQFQFGNFPREWEPQKQTMQLFNVHRGDVEWHKIEGMMKKTLPNVLIQGIQRVQNKWIWRKYSLQKQMMIEKNGGYVNELELFHGTRHNLPQDIYGSEEGFDVRHSNKGLWGEANYFAADASYSDKYAYSVSSNSKQIFLAKVLTGESKSLSSPNKDLRMPPVKSAPVVSIDGLAIGKDKVNLLQVRYDSVTGETKGSKVYMTYDNLRAYPAYLITYTITVPSE